MTALADDEIDRAIANLATGYHFESRPVDLVRDAETVHRWLTHPKAEYWGMLDCSRADAEELIRHSANTGGAAHFGLRIGYYEGSPEFLFELYDPTIGDLAAPGTGYSHRSGDIGMHLLVASSERELSGFTAAVMLHIMRTAFLEVGAQRVVVEPDVRNLEVQRLNAAVGFVVEGDHPVADKIARLSYCTRADFLRVTDGGLTTADVSARAEGGAR
ncbi:GNAT family N-acetyltransferase [Nocardia bovistercoris]|uniref:GNAT family N-acetyltransferase n=1 Tax=Nocardia bovistercoris TaxID=2785916 RepID=UPI002FCD53C0